MVRSRECEQTNKLFSLLYMNVQTVHTRQTGIEQCLSKRIRDKKNPRSSPGFIKSISVGLLITQDITNRLEHYQGGGFMGKDKAKLPIRCNQIGGC
jgi:hypothetical protein